ncbi:MAG: hypothetical protein HY673_07450 [Chloroflexi bacterium]|nr:hypothetical protein [Chloroflexota bacterium]
MENHEMITLETVLGLAKRLNAAEKLKLIEYVLRELEPIIEAQKPGEQKLLRNSSKGQTFADEEVEGAGQKLWGAVEEGLPKRVVQLGGLWKDIQFDVSNENIRKARRELSEAIRRRTEGL